MEQFDFSAHLQAGEKLLWSGRPRQGLLLTARDWLLVPFSLFWGGFVLFWETAATVHPGASFFPLFGLPFAVIGAYLIVGRFIVDAWLRSRTYYAVTNQRIIICREGPFFKISSA